MKRTGRILALILALTMVLAGCSSGGGSPAAPPASPTVPASSPASSGTAGSEPASGGAPAETNWPTKTVQIIAGGKPGGDTDFNARVYLEPLQRELGQSFVVVNVDGSGGSIASRQVYEADPDGYTVLITHLSHACSMAAGMIDFGYRDYEMIGIIGRSAGDVMVVNSASPWQSVDELVQAAKADPNQIKMAVNTGSTTYAEAKAFALAAEIEFNIVDAGGAADKAVALKGQHIDVTLLPYGTAKPYLESGDFRALAVANQERNPKFPDTPTFVENGYDVICPTSYCFMMPKGTPQEIVDKFTAACKKIALEDEEYAKNIDTAYGQDPFFMDAPEALEFYDEMVIMMDKYCQ